MTENTKIEKTNNGEIITIADEENSITFKLNKTEKKVILKISADKTYEYILKEEDGKINTYSPKKFNYRIKFVDQYGDIYDLPVTDLAFRCYCSNLRKTGLDISDIGLHIKQSFKESLVFLRIGLTRLYKDRHWIQITGVYAFPDYLSGREDIYCRTYARQTRTLGFLSSFIR